jgi:hypothetical protein
MNKHALLFFSTLSFGNDKKIHEMDYNTEFTKIIKASLRVKKKWNIEKVRFSI